MISIVRLLKPSVVAPLTSCRLPWILVGPKSQRTPRLSYPDHLDTLRKETIEISRIRFCTKTSRWEHSSDFKHRAPPTNRYLRSLYRSVPQSLRAASRRPTTNVLAIAVKKRDTPDRSSRKQETRHSFLELTIDIVRYSGLIGVSIVVILMAVVLTLKLFFSLVGPV